MLIRFQKATPLQMANVCINPFAAEGYLVNLTSWQKAEKWLKSRHNGYIFGRTMRGLLNEYQHDRD